MLNNLHIDDKVEAKFKIIYENGKLKQKEFSKKKFSIDFAPYFKKVPYFNIEPQEVFHASKAMDEWIREEYKHHEFGKAYIERNDIPGDIQERLPKTLKVFWDILHKVNQNKNCNFLILSKPIPGFDGLDMNFFTGRKATSPFSHDEKIDYTVLTIYGKTKDIDRIMEPYLL